jgi:regulatory protein
MIMPEFMFKSKNKTKEPENLDKAYEYAVFLLSLKLRTIGEVLKKMQDRGYTEAVIADVIERLKNQKYLDDERYAEIFLENLKQYKNLGFYGIKKKFMEKKLPQQLIDRVLGEGFTPADELKIAKRFLKKEGFEVKKEQSDDEGVTYRTYGDEEQNKEKMKKSQRLKSRGFRGDIIAKLVF